MLIHFYFFTWFWVDFILFFVFLEFFFFPFFLVNIEERKFWYFGFI